MALREYTDGRGTRWTVWSVSSEALHPATRSEAFLRQFSSGWLCFESDSGEKRRLIDYPEGWESLPDAALATLCDAAVPRAAGPSADGPGAMPGAAADAAIALAESRERRRSDIAAPPEHPRRRREDRPR